MLHTVRWTLCGLLLAASPVLAGDGGNPEDFETEADRRPTLQTGGDLFIRGATLLTVSQGTIEDGSILIRGGKIAALGRALVAPDGVTVLEGDGLFVMPGIIDCHSHIAIEGGINEGSQSVVAEVRIDDEVNHRDLSIYRALAGGTTAANLLHGSANVIGGQNATVKFRYGKSAAEMMFDGAPRGVKFALGENVKRSSSRRRQRPLSDHAHGGRDACCAARSTTPIEYREDLAALRGGPVPRQRIVLEPRRETCAWRPWWTSSRGGSWSTATATEPTRS